MRVKEFDDRAICLTEEEWHKLLYRFDLNRVIKRKGCTEEEYEIPNTGCSLCMKYRKTLDDCGSCPLHGKTGSCGSLVEVIVGGHPAFFMERSSGVWWDFENDEKAREQVEQVYDALKNMRRESRRIR